MDIRSQHWTDVPVEGRRRKRTIRNWSNFRTPHHNFREARPLIINALGVPDDWDGAFDFLRTSQAGALQTFFGDSSDSINPAMVGLRLADRPAFWVNFRAMGTLPNPVVVAEGARHAWRGLWKNTTLRYVDSAYKLTKEIVLREPGHPARFRFSVKLPPHLSLVFRNGGAAVLGPLGNERLTLPAPWGEDAEGKTVRATMRQDLDTVLGLPVIVIEVNEDDLAGAVYPVTIDPTVTISGTTDIEDNILYSPSPNGNFGGNTLGHIQKFNRNSLIRFMASTIPEGTITALRLYITVEFLNGVLTGYFYHIADANDWVEGTQTAGIEVGASCWNYAKYDTQPWSQTGCSHAGVDYDNDPSPPEVNITGTGPYQINLKPEWATNWRDGNRVANGIIVGPNTVAAGGTIIRWYSTEGATPLYFEIDYEEAPTGSAIAAMAMPRRIL